MKGRGAVLALVLVLAAMLGWLFHSRFYWAREDTWVGYQGEALDNDYLAAQRLLQRTGHGAACLRGLPDPLPPPGDLLILPGRIQPMAPADAARLTHWVAAGGLLLAGAIEPQDTLFERFGARLVPGADDPGPISFTLDGSVLGLEQHGRIQTPEGQAGIVRRQLGRGSALLCADLNCLRNDRIAAFDHADFLCAVAAERPLGRVWIVTGDAMETAWSWLWQRARPAVIALAALCVAALWAAAPRFGPILPDPDPARRSFLEHLDASGRYQWRTAQGRPLLEAARGAFLHRLAQRQPAWADLEPEQLHQRLAQRSGLPRDRISRALNEPAAHAAGFLEAIQTLHLLGKQL
jgi:hypothetical protein